MSVTESYAANLDAEFLYEAGDTLAQFEVLVGNLRAKQASPKEAIESLRKDVKKLLVLSSTADQPLFGLLLRRLDAYLADLDDPTGNHIDDVDTFVDVMRGILDGEVGKDVDEAEFVRSLPVRRPIDIEDVQHLNIEILVVDPKRTITRYVERDLVNCGYRVSMVHRSFEAMELTIRTRPDMVIASAMLDEMTGVDLACALAAIPGTSEIPFALLTTFEAGHESLDRLPSKAALIRKGDNFGADLALTLAGFKLT